MKVKEKPMFEKLFELKNLHTMKRLYPLKYGENVKTWYDYNITAVTTQDIEMRVWNGTRETENHICKKGTRARVTMVSRFGDVGITDNMDRPNGYDVRVDPDKHLTDYKFEER